MRTYVETIAGHRWGMVILARACLYMLLKLFFATILCFLQPCGDNSVQQISLAGPLQCMQRSV